MFIEFDQIYISEDRKITKNLKQKVKWLSQFVKLNVSLEFNS